MSPEGLVREVLRAVPLVDGHNDLAWQVAERAEGDPGAFDLEDTSHLDPPMHTDLRRLRAGGVGGVFLAAYVPSDLPEAEALKRTLVQVDLIRRLVARHPEHLAPAWTADEVEAAHRGGRVAALIGVEGAHGLDGSLAVFRLLRALGMRYLTLTHWHPNAAADAATSPPRHGGLSDFGREVVREANRLGVLVDLSHVSDAVMRQAMTESRAPCLFSHSSARALCGHPRNVPDDVLAEVGRTGGVVMVNFGPFFLSDALQRWVAEHQAEAARQALFAPGRTAEEAQAQLEAWRAAHPAPQVPLSRLVDHVDHVARVAGIDHVGLGSDYDGIQEVPVGAEDVSRFPAVLEALAARGWSREALEKLAGRNVLRVMRAAEDVARG